EARDRRLRRDGPRGDRERRRRDGDPRPGARRRRRDLRRRDAAPGIHRVDLQVLPRSQAAGAAPEGRRALLRRPRLLRARRADLRARGARRPQGARVPAPGDDTALQDRAPRAAHARDPDHPERLVSEFDTRAMAETALWREFECPKELGAGVLDLKNFYVESPDLVARRIRRLLESVKAERLWINPDCGLARLPRHLAFAKLQ